MSDKKHVGASFTAPELPHNLPADALLDTASRSQREAYFWKKFFEDSRLRKWIVFSGLGAIVVAILEVLRFIWLAIRFFVKF
jgi:hypothetical protein